MKENRLIKLASRVILLAAVLLVGLYLGKQRAFLALENSAGGDLSQSVIKGTSLMVDFGDGTLKIFPEVFLSEGQSAFDVLKTATDENGVDLSYKDYGGDLGVFIEAIGGVKNNSREGYWWQYWVNNEYGRLGVSSYKIRVGDVIEWKFIKGQQAEN